MKRPPLHTLILLSVFLHSGFCSGGDEQCKPLFVLVGGNATIRCSITDPEQDGVYMYIQQDVNVQKDTLFYYYKDGEFTPEDLYTGRVKTNKDFGNFTVFLSNVSEHDEGVYWCLFNRRIKNTVSDRTCLLVQSVSFSSRKMDTDCKKFIFLGVIGGLSFIILVLVALLVKQCCDRGNYKPKQQSSNGVYEVMHGRTSKALINPAYESRETHNKHSTHNR